MLRRLLVLLLTLVGEVALHDQPGPEGYTPDYIAKRVWGNIRAFLIVVGVIAALIVIYFCCWILCMVLRREEVRAARAGQEPAGGAAQHHVQYSFIPQS